MHRNRSSDVLMGILAGSVLAVLYSVAAAIIYIVSGPERGGESLAAVLTAYWIGGLLSGLLLGLLRPQTTSRRGAMLVGPLIAAPAVACLRIMTDGLPWTWSSDTIAASLITALIFGIYGGYVFGGRPDRTLHKDRP